MPEDSKKSNRRLIFAIIGSLGIFIFLILVVTTIIQTTTPEYISASISKTIQATLSMPTDIPPTNTPEPSATPEAKQLLIQKLQKALGSGNRDQPRLIQVTFDTPDKDNIYVQWSINDNLSDGLVVYGAKQDVITIMQTLITSNYFFTAATISGYFPITDQYGHTREENVVTLYYDRYTIGYVDWVNAPVESIYETANEKTINSLFE